MEAPAKPAAAIIDPAEGPAKASAPTAVAAADDSVKRPREEPVAHQVPLTPGLNVFPEGTSAGALDIAAAAASEPDVKRQRIDPIIAPALAGQSVKAGPQPSSAPLEPAVIAPAEPAAAIAAATPMAAVTDSVAAVLDAAPMDTTAPAGAPGDFALPL